MDLTITSLVAACLSMAVLFVATKMIQQRPRTLYLYLYEKENKEEELLLPPVMSVVSVLTAYLPTLIAKGLPAVIHDLHSRLGSVFTVSVFGLKKVTLLVGPEVTAHFFQASESEIRQSNIYKVSVPVFGRGVLYDVDLATRSRQISFCTDSIKPINLRGHVDSMVHEVEREEDKVGGKFSYTPFSAGRHVCLGEDFAYMQIKVIWSHLLRNFDLELISPFPEEEWEKFIPGPKGKVMAEVETAGGRDGVNGGLAGDQQQAVVDAAPRVGGRGGAGGESTREAMAQRQR
uniref:Uncharacterized protein n=1 Tax=Oryza meridionalis TaxID=40149 RepID=A0A0E0CDU4_9ORYZ